MLKGISFADKIVHSSTLKKDEMKKGIDGYTQAVHIVKDYNEKKEEEQICYHRIEKIHRDSG